MSVDGTDFRIIRPSRDDLKKIYSHKFKSSGLRYEVALCIQTGDLVWTNGPFPCGSYPDISIFLQDLAPLLREGERVEADLGYAGWPDFVDTPKDNVFGDAHQAQAKAFVRARHEHVNSRLKNFKILSERFRHDRATHGLVFRVCAITTQIGFECGNPLPSVFYKTLTEKPVISSDDEQTDSDEEQV